MTANVLPSQFAERLGAWQFAHGRHGMPWQNDRTAYRVWLSEVMLQQTQVVTVIGYFERFLEKFPTVRDLAAAPQADVLALWSGLGYYSRARNLHACAQAVVRDFGGEFPADVELLVTLPGIGPSTAAAISSICFLRRVSIFDGNVKRVVARLANFDGDTASAANERELKAIAQSGVPEDGALMPRHTQALMDLGATLCTPRAPRCGDCPFTSDCLGKSRALELPVNTRKTARKRLDNHWLWLTHEGKTWVQQRPEKGIWGGLWSLPTLDDQQIEEILRRGEWSDRAERHAPIKHVLTHRDWYLSPVKINLSASEAAELDDDERLTPGRWIAHEQVNTIGMPAPLLVLLQAAAGV